MAETGESVDTVTVGWVLFQSQLNGRVAKSSHCKKSHMTFFGLVCLKACERSQASWKTVVWSAETETELLGHQTKRYVWSSPSTTHQQKHIIPTVKLDGGNMLLRCFSAGGSPQKCSSLACIEIVTFSSGPTFKSYKDLL